MIHIHTMESEMITQGNPLYDVLNRYVSSNVYNMCEQTTAHNVMQIKMQMAVFHGDLRLSAPCSLFGHAIQFNTVYAVIITVSRYVLYTVQCTYSYYTV